MAVGREAKVAETVIEFEVWGSSSESVHCLSRWTSVSEDVEQDTVAGVEAAVLAMRSELR